MVCCVTGHRPHKFPFPYDCDDPKYLSYLDALCNAISDLILSGYDTFFSGMADGVDLDFAEFINQFKEEYSEYSIFLKAALPYPPRPCKGEASEYRQRLERILPLCDEVHVVSPKYSGGCMQERNKFMVDRSDLVLAIWNGECKGGTWNTIKYALSVGKPVRYILLNKINVTTSDEE